MGCDCCDTKSGRQPSKNWDYVTVPDEPDYDPKWIKRMNAFLLGNCAMDDEIIKQIWGGIAARKITICGACDTIFSYSRNKRYCDECVISHRREYRQKNKAKRNASQREYRKNNLEKVRAIELKSEEKRRSNGLR
jgi:hypothetical protein